jgi:hypothetical protein
VFNVSGPHHELIIETPTVIRPSSKQAKGAHGWTGAEEKTMSYPTIDIGDKKIILLSGFEKVRGDRETLVITAKDQLKASTKKHRDAVAFGYVSGMWVPAA